ncbi:WD40 repeat-like protein [Choiromyces venosus 120613-1]|uniref:DNA damage-binding protein CMR1 n=1 Tax=Choiromyces venosus 120613-1 TaxID=1336337 RepID=A0A3N4JRM5_9PEZI|nr:WD40 repeat-like protein [Choiromyces venosus 120613-1]
MEEPNEYERRREENILRNKEILQRLQIDAASVAATRIAARSSSGSASKPKNRSVKKEPQSPLPRRKSSRLAGLPADSEVTKRKYDEEVAALEEAEKAKRMRVAGDLSFDIKQGLVDITKGARFERTFTDENVKKTTNKDLKAMRQKMMGLKLYDRHLPNDIKICPERIYYMGFHPTTDKQLIFAGDKLGTLGIFDAQSNKEDEYGNPIADISQYKVHSRSISTFAFDTVSATSLYTSSYDGSIRKFDLATGVASEVFVTDDGDAFSGVEVHDANMLYFATLDGLFGRRDLRQKRTDVWPLHGKKIGGFSTHPRAPHLLATSSLDRTLKIWDLRQVVKAPERTPWLVAEHPSRLSVSSALWSSTGSLATTSYDDTVKIFNFPDAIKWGPTSNFGTIEPDTTIPHNNQTGRWVTILRAQWQQAPPNGQQKLVIANMNRFLDIYSENGEQLAELSDENVTAVPAAVQFHPTQDWVAGGTSSGKVVLFR